MSFERVEVDRVVKVFGATPALAGATLKLEQGEVTVLEGPNGSGKSTLISLLALLTRPTSGHIRFGEFSASRATAEVRGLIGVATHASMLYPSLTGRQNLALFAQLYRVAHAERRIADIAQRFALNGFMDRTTAHYSRGQLQRTTLARALLHAPRLLLLDEPSVGLDVTSLANLTEALDEERARGTIVMLVTHDGELASRVADRRVRLERGRVIPGEKPS